MGTEETLSGAGDRHLASEFAAKSETAAQVQDPARPMNELIRRALNKAGGPPA